MIDFILIPIEQKHILQNARSRNGMRTSSDHRMVITNMRIDWYIIYNQRRNNNSELKLDMGKLTREKQLQKEYQSYITREIDKIDENERDWNKTKTILIKAAEDTVGRIKKSHQGNIYNREIEELSVKQKDLRLQINQCNDNDKKATLKYKRNTILREIKQQLKKTDDEKIDNIINEIESYHTNDARMFKAVKHLKKPKEKTDSFIHDKEGKSVKNENEQYKILKSYFTDKFYNENKPQIKPFTQGPKKLNNPISINEVTTAMKKNEQ